MAQDTVPAVVLKGQIGRDLEKLEAERSAALAKIERDYDQKIAPLKGAYDYYARLATEQAEVEEEEPTDTLNRLPPNWLAQETLRFAAEIGRFFHVNELDDRLARRMEEEFPGVGLTLQDKAGSRTLRRLWRRGEIARVTYGAHSHHYFHGTRDLVRLGFNGPEFVSPEVAPPQDFLEGVEGEPPEFPSPQK